MFETTVSRDLPVDADTAWSLLVDWGNTDWLPGPEKTEVITSGSQVTRRLHMNGVEPIEETMLSNDPAAKTLHYTIAVSEMFPLEDYRGTVAVVPSDNGCRVDWYCRFAQGAMSDDEAAAIAARNLNFLLDSLAGYLAQADSDNQ